MNHATLRDKNLQTTLQILQRKYGKGTIMRLNHHTTHTTPTISTGSLGLNLALGVGGLPCGRIVELYGPESSGKTTLALHTIAEAQKKGGIAVLIDSEHAFDIDYAKALGVRTDELLINQPDHGEQALEIADHLIRSGSVALVVVDSVAALLPKHELDGEIGQQSVGLQARLMSKALRKITGTIHKTGAVCLFINQLRQKVGLVFGNPEITPGGNALKFYASVRLEIRKTITIKQLDKVVGHGVKVKVAKNKLASPFTTANFDLLYGKGINTLGEMIDLGISLGILNQSGAWVAYDKQQLGQGKIAAQEALAADIALQRKLMTSIKAKY